MKKGLARVEGAASDAQAALAVWHGGDGARLEVVDAELRAAAERAASGNEVLVLHDENVHWALVLGSAPGFGAALQLELGHMPSQLVDSASAARVIAARDSVHTTPCIPGMQLFPGFVTPEDEARLLLALGVTSDGALGAEWERRSDGGRRVRHFGLRFDYSTGRADTRGAPCPWPKWCAELCERLVAEALVPLRPNQVTVNLYLPGEGIPFHCDTHSAFGPVLCSLSLCSQAVMRFRPARELAAACDADRQAPAPHGLVLPARSMLVLADEARYGWQHSIAARKYDDLGGCPTVSEAAAVCVRQLRVSVTLRHVAEGALGPDEVGSEMCDARDGPSPEARCINTPCACQWPSLCDRC